jgi:hypothetical protein
VRAVSDAGLVRRLTPIPTITSTSNTDTKQTTPIGGEYMVTIQIATVGHRFLICKGRYKKKSLGSRHRVTCVNVECSSGFSVIRRTWQHSDSKINDIVDSSLKVEASGSHIYSPRSNLHN